MGNRVERLTDVGVAGLHRLLHHVPILQAANVVVAVAGMEGALPSVVAGLVAAPVIALPTSVGYGASFDGLAALVQNQLEADPFSGHLFVFRGRRGDRIKVLWWDGDGLCLYAKRLERGRFGQGLLRGFRHHLERFGRRILCRLPFVC
mgnify:CR=1 FL=1